MSTYFASCRVNDSGYPLNGRLGGCCLGLVPRVPRVAGYDPTNLDKTMFFSSGKRLGNQVPHIGYGPTAPT
jgi:hypothetical protein